MCNQYKPLWHIYFYPDGEMSWRAHGYMINTLLPDTLTAKHWITIPQKSVVSFDITFFSLVHKQRLWQKNALQQLKDQHDSWQGRYA
jgi:hypothetical protein